MKILIFISLIVVSSCSTLKKTLIYSAGSGAMLGAASGLVLSPDKDSRGANAAVFGLVGAGVSSLIGYALYEDDPRNTKLKSMIREKRETDPNVLDLPLGNLNIEANLEKKEKYQVPLKKLPKELEGKASKQYLIKYRSEERYVKKDGKTFYIPSFEILEHAYDEKVKGEL